MKTFNIRVERNTNILSKSPRAAKTILATVATLAISTLTLSIASPISPAYAGVSVNPQKVAPLTKASALSMLKQLKVAVPRTTGYDRDLFNVWVDADRDGCNTRAEVLMLETLAATTTTSSSSCTISTGKWFSPYNNQTYTSARKLDVDHMVPLSEAWQSGAYNWGESTREAFGNDLGYAGSLIAVDLSSNRSKGDRDPASWLPRQAYVCTYVATWVSVKWRWKLSVDKAELAQLTRTLSNCAANTIIAPKR